MSSEPSTSKSATTTDDTNTHVPPVVEYVASPADNENGEQIINWVQEATAIINDVKTHVAEIDISKKLPSNESHIYLNIRTFEGATYCVHVSSNGFRIVSEIYDTIDEDKKELKNKDEEGDGDGDDKEKEAEFFETPYALLDKISPSYVESFGNQLCKQLLKLQQMRTEFNEEDEEGLEEEEEEKEKKEEEKEKKEDEKEKKEEDEKEKESGASSQKNTSKTPV